MTRPRAASGELTTHALGCPPHPVPRAHAVMPSSLLASRLHVHSACSGLASLQRSTSDVDGESKCLPYFVVELPSSAGRHSPLASRYRPPALPAPVRQRAAPHWPSQEHSAPRRRRLRLRPLCIGKGAGAHGCNWRRIWSCAIEPWSTHCTQASAGSQEKCAARPTSSHVL